MDSCKVNQEVLSEIGKAIDRIQYGEVIVTIHNDKVVQIERREKKRLIEQ